MSEIHTFSFKKMHLKMSSAKWRQFVSASICHLPTFQMWVYGSCIGLAGVRSKQDHNTDVNLSRGSWQSTWNLPINYQYFPSWNRCYLCLKLLIVCLIEYGFGFANSWSDAMSLANRSTIAHAIAAPTGVWRTILKVDVIAWGSGS